MIERSMIIVRKRLTEEEQWAKFREAVERTCYFINTISVNVPEFDQEVDNSRPTRPMGLPLRDYAIVDSAVVVDYNERQKKIKAENRDFIKTFKRNKKSNFWGLKNGK